MAGPRGTGRGAAAQAGAVPLGIARTARQWAPHDWRRWLRDCADEEIAQRRLFPWIAVAFGFGILLFFAAEGQPALWPPVTAATVAVLAAVFARRRLVGFAAAVAVTALFLGFAAGVVRMRHVDAPVLGRLTIAPFAGFIESIDERADGARLVVRVHSLTAVERPPQRVRVTLRDRQSLKAGDFISGTARLLPPPEPARPGGYDFARDAYFRGIGAVGTMVGRVAAGPPPVALDLSLRAAAAIDGARNALTRRIADAVGGQAGAVAAALVTGKRGLIDEETNDALRAAGIYHIVSISGLHMVLAAGTVFWLTRALLALSASIALLWPVKKIAAVVAMAGATAYCVFSGSEVATERALIMTLVMLGAILVDRPALSMRNLAVSALIVLAREPEALLGPSFQMSYAAVAALIATAEWVRGRVLLGEGAGPLGRMAHWLLGAVAALVVTTVVATVATAPFGSYHFHTLNPFGLVGNALAVPLVSLAVMPCAVLGILTFPFGLDRPVWELMGFVVGLVLRLSEWVKGFSGSSVLVPAFSVEALALMALALIVATLLVSPLRVLAVVPGVTGVWLATSPERFDVYVARDGVGAAVRGDRGPLVVLGRPPAFVIEQWLKADGDARPADDAGVKSGARCDLLGCTIERADGRAVALVNDRRAFGEDCRRAALLISRLPAPATCKPAILVDGRFLAANGPTAIRFTASGHEVVSARRPDETRPWLARRERGRTTRAAEGSGGSVPAPAEVDPAEQLDSNPPGGGPSP